MLSRKVALALCAEQLGRARWNTVPFVFKYFLSHSSRVYLVRAPEYI